MSLVQETFANRVRQAGSTPAAFLIIAEGIDRVLEQLAARPTHMAEDGWGAWGGSSWSEGPADAGSQGQQAAAPSSPFEPIKVVVDPADLERAREAQKVAETNFERISARGQDAGQSPADWRREREDALHAMRAAQAKVRQLEDPGEIMPNAGFVPGEGEATRTSEVDGQIVVDLPDVDEQRKAARRKLAEAINLPSFFGPLYQQPEVAEQLIHSYEVGGPLWLNAVGKEDGKVPVIMQMPTNVRQAMVADVHMDSPRLAWELGREILKDEGSDTLDVSAGFISSLVDHGGTPYAGKGDA